MARDIERRTVNGEVRAARDEKRMGLDGYAALYNVETVIGGWFREVIQEGAFADVLTDDVRGTFNHSEDVILSRTRNSTLRLKEDSRGLWYEMDLNPDDPDAIRVYAKVQRGDVNQSSFAFYVSPDGEEWDYSETKQGKLPLRRITKVDQLLDVAAVAYPAYDATSVSARAKERAEDNPLVRAEAERAAASVRWDLRRRRQEIAERE